MSAMEGAVSVLPNKMRMVPVGHPGKTGMVVMVPAGGGSCGASVVVGF
jgi:hypothetical protein